MVYINQMVGTINAKGEKHMNISRFTQKSMEAVNNCERIAYEFGNQEIEQEHLLYSLLTLEDSLISGRTA